MDPVAIVGALAAALVLATPSVILVITAIRTRRDVAEVKEIVVEAVPEIRPSLEALHNELAEERRRLFDKHMERE